jgi:hypothetical protein
MYVVAANATYIRLGVRRTQKIGVSCRVTAQAPGVYILGSGLGRIEYFGLVAAALDVRPARPVAILAGNSGPPCFGAPGAAIFQSHAVMGIGLELFGHIFMARSAGFRAYIVRRGRIFGLWSGRHTTGRLRAPCSGAQNTRAKQQHQNSSQSRSPARNRTNQRMHYWPILVH